MKISDAFLSGADMSKFIVRGVDSASGPDHTAYAVFFKGRFCFYSSSHATQQKDQGKMTNTKFIEPEISAMMVTPGPLQNAVEWALPSDTYGNCPVILTRLPPFPADVAIAPGVSNYLDLEVQEGVEYLYTVSCMDSRGLQSAPIYASGIPLEEEEEEEPPPPGSHIYVTVNGSPTSNGTQADPCTLQRAAQIVTPGTTVHVAAGVYTSNTDKVLELTVSGDGDIYVRWEAEPGVEITNPNGYGIYGKNVSSNLIKGFEVRNCSLKGIAFREGSPTNPMLLNHIDHCHVHDCTQEGMYLSQWRGGFITDCVIENVGLSGVETTGHGIYLANAGSGSVMIHRCTIDLPLQAVGAAIHMNGDLSSSAGTNGIISGVSIYGCRLFGGIKGVSGDGVDHSEVVNCIIDIQKNGARFGHGIRLYQSDGGAGAQNCTIFNNTIRCGTGGSASAIRLTSEAGPQRCVFNNLTISNDQYYFTGPSASNLNGANFDVGTYAPNATAQAGGAASCNGIVAPTHDINGVARTAPVTIGAIE